MFLNRTYLKHKMLEITNVKEFLDPLNISIKQEFIMKRIIVQVD